MRENSLILNGRVALALCTAFFVVIPALRSYAAIPLLSAQYDGTNVAVTFTGRLLASQRVDGPYTNVLNATNPYLWPSANSPKQFWRSRMLGTATFAAGAEHTLAIKADGTLWSWGLDAFGQNKATNAYDDDGNGYTNDVFGINARNDAHNPPQYPADPIDGDGHGSHVAGIIGAVGNNGTGVAGVAWRVRLMALNNGDSQLSSAIQCIDYAVDKGAHIINASWGLHDFSQALLDAIRAAGNQGIIFVAAAGNYGGDRDNDAASDNLGRYPATYEADNIVTVAYDQNKHLGSVLKLWARPR